MTQRDMARFYLRHWMVDGSGTPSLADNAPLDLRQLITTIRAPKWQVHDALVAMATSMPAAVPPLPEILLWFSTNPPAHEACDELLKAKKPPQSFNELMQRAYKAEFQILMDQVRNFLNARLGQ